MGLYWGEGKGSEKPPVQTEVQEVLNRNEVSTNHWEQICSGEVASGPGEFCSFSRLNYTKPIATQSQFKLTLGLGELQKSFPASVICNYDVLNLGKIP